ncbi:prostaglandin D2 receptor 2 [Megalops cyprinoides]|uniref:prostaglandin D2 receptor 2 n=1 Tax=Megalops cyprinoides TaxID=118141 RepID=UPI001864E25B|nr:prostaglandin D2 receptor 2 [Megalops cyprinoides]
MNLSNLSSPLLCPALQHMFGNHSLNSNTRANMAVVSVHGLFSALGIAENALILWVVGLRVRKTVAAVWVVNLALSDFLATLTLPLFTYYLSVGHSWNLGESLCVTQSAIFFLNMFFSAFLLAAISLDRCLLVVQPIWSKNHRSVATAWRVCGLGWLWAVANALPYALFRSVTTKPDGRNLCYHNFARYSSADSLKHDCWMRQNTTALSKFLLAFLLPLGVIAISYTSLTLKLRQRQRQREFQAFATASRGRLALSSRRFSRMVVAVIAVFILCWSPYHVVCLMEVAYQRSSDGMQTVAVALPVATTLSFLNAVLNPILYTFSCPHFCVKIRESLGALLEGLLEEADGELLQCHCTPQDSTTDGGRTNG